MKRKLYTLLSVLLTLALCMAVFAENSQVAPVVTTEKGIEPAAAKPEITLNVFSMRANFAGEQTGWFGKIIKDKFNIKLNILASNIEGGASRLQTLMASGDLGDIVIMGDDSADYRDCIASGLLLDWTKGDLLKKYGKDILARAPKAIEKNKMAYGNGKSVYSIGYDVSDMPAGVSSEGKDLTWSPDIRWDLYVKAGMPKIKTMEDYLPVLKKMQELEPTNESGKPVYGFTLFADWDGDKMMCSKQFVNMYGYDEIGIIFPHATEPKYQHTLQADGYYVRTLKLYYNANKMGLLDPDSISQKWGDVWGKYADGRCLFSWWWWLGQSAYNTPERTAAGKGFQCVPAADQKVLSLGFDPYGKSGVIAIGGKTKYPERVMELINWLYTSEGLMTMYNGPQKMTWELKTVGKAQKLNVTEFGWMYYEKKDTIIPDGFGGGTYGSGECQINFPPIRIETVDPKYKEPYDHNLWATSLERNPSNLVKDWRAKMKAMTSKEYLTKNKLIIVEPAVSYGKAPMAMSDDIQQKYNQIQPIIKQYSWKMCFAADDAEFDALLKEMTEKAKGLGYDDVLAFYTAKITKEIFEPRKALKKK